jgi:dienelactone hydrolase
MKIKLFQFVFLMLFVGVQGFAQYNIGSKSYRFYDESRNRRIDSRIYFPEGASGEIHEDGNFPVVVFGHGFLMRWDAYENIWEALVPEGYILVFPRTEGNFWPSHQRFGDDLAYIMEEVQSMAGDPSSFLYEGVAEETAVVGHSMGGGSGVLAASNHPLVTTYIGLAPAETNPSAISAAQDVTVDALLLYGEADGVTPYEEHALPIYQNLSSDCKTLITILGGGHCYFAKSNFYCSFGENSSSGNITISRDEQQQISQQYMLLWLDHKLKGASYNTFSSALQGDDAVSYIQSCTAPTVIETQVEPVAFPNPGTGVFTLSGFKNLNRKSKVVQLIDSSGQVENIRARRNKNELVIDISDKKPGIYRINVNTSKGARQLTIRKI